MIRLFVAALLMAVAAGPSRADDIVLGWSTARMPPPPALKPVRVDPARTALLLLDFDTHNCTADKRVRCFASLPAVSALLYSARSHGTAVVYSTAGTATLADVPPPLGARTGDPVVHAGVDKFLGTKMESILKARNVRTVIVTGTSAHGAVLYTASEAALRGLDVVVPVDGLSADDPFAELVATWTLANAPVSVSSHVTLTRSDQIGY